MIGEVRRNEIDLVAFWQHAENAAKNRNEQEKPEAANTSEVSEYRLLQCPRFCTKRFKFVLVCSTYSNVVFVVPNK